MDLFSPRILLFLVGCIAVCSAAPSPQFFYDNLSYEEDYDSLELDFIDGGAPFLKPLHAPFMGKKPPPPGAQNSGRAGHPPTDGHPTVWHPVIIPRPPPGRPRPVRPIIPRLWQGKYVLF
ncbi:Protein virilizer [Orchesella cincta]|uniref:Protein virilizer n=1 Tax=Orchesella cincta TaxID=48709 RepID=A0A1D2MQ61_ORCCI|nr:Protein virilizer [Orchesella cincta]